jgi:hypothetical protein
VSLIIVLNVSWNHWAPFPNVYRDFLLILNSVKDGVAYTGSRYHLPSKKRDTAASDCVRPNLLSLEDGQQFDVSQLDDAQYEALTELAFNHALTDGIPEVYKSFAIPK